MISVRFTYQALEQAEKITRWWRANRLAAPDLFERELDKAVALLAEHPEAGARAAQPDAPRLRRWLLKKTHYHVYYMYDADQSEVVVMSVWASMRGHGPPIKAP